MIKNLFFYPFQFIFLVIFQVLILNNIQFSGFVNPFLYLFFIISLPLETPKWLLMLLSFLIGLSVDIFSGTLGMHASASVFLAFCRPYILNLIAPREGYEVNQKPSISELGFSWYLTYSALSVLLHHLFLFFVEVFRFSDFFATLGRVLASSLFTLVIILISQLFFFQSKSGK